MSALSLHLRTGLLAIVAVAAAACSTIGEKGFACPGRPPGVRCMSATEVYGATHNTDYVEPTSDKALGDDPQSTKQRRASVKAHDRPSPMRTNETLPPTVEPPAGVDLLRTQAIALAIDRPIPIRTPAQVMRAWIAPWEDARGVLHAGGYAFIEIESRRWTFGETATAEPVRFFSLQNIAADAKETVGKDRSVPGARAGTSERSQRPNSSTLPNTGASK
jgi:conjugal transfer pilus assembly protein TraV